MNAMKDIFIYTGIVGGGSVSLSYLVPEFWQPFAIVMLMISAVAIGIHDYVTAGESAISVQTTSMRRANPKEAGVEVEKTESSGIYFAAGVLIFGSLVLFF